MNGATDYLLGGGSADHAPQVWKRVQEAAKAQLPKILCQHTEDRWPTQKEKEKPKTKTKSKKQRTKPKTIPSCAGRSKQHG